MSVKVMDRVWELDLPPHQKIVLLAYADSAEHDGTEIWPGWENLCRMTSYSRRNVDRITGELIAAGYLEQIDRGHRGRRASFRIPMKAGQIVPLSPLGMWDTSGTLSDPESETDCPTTDGDSETPSVRKCDTGVSPPVLSRPNTPTSLRSVGGESTTRDVTDPIWDRLVEIVGPPATNQRALYGRLVHMIAQNYNGTGVQELERRAAAIANWWGPERVTAASIEKHWGRADSEAGQATKHDIKRLDITARAQRLASRPEGLPE